MNSTVELRHTHPAVLHDIPTLLYHSFTLLLFLISKRRHRTAAAAQNVSSQFKPSTNIVALSNTSQNITIISQECPEDDGNYLLLLDILNSTSVIISTDLLVRHEWNIT